jgi:superfamily II DNA or RNA helicase
LWLTNTKDLLNQAKERCENNLNCSTSVITDGKCDSSGDIVFATVQTLSNIIDKEEIKQDEFGLLIMDECHHLASNAESVMMFEKCINYFSARYKMGITATLHRSDGLEKTTTKLIGNVIYELKKNDTKDKLIGYYEGKPVVEVPSNMFQVPARITFVKTNYSVMDKDVYDKTGRIMFTKLITDISQDEERNQQILSILHGLDKPTIVISERVDQLHYLSEKTPNSVYIDGKTKKDIREQSIADFKDNKYNVLFASYSLVAEGLDIPQLEYLIMATPVKDERLVIQSIGRCQRPSKGKTLAKVYDLVDNVGMLDRFTAKRKSVYKKEGWDIL